MNKLWFTLVVFFLCSIACAQSLPIHSIKAYDCSRCPSLSHDRLEYKWPISNNQKITSAITNKQKSYSYHQKITTKQLQAGVTLSHLSVGAIIRISPITTKEMPHLLLETPAHRLLTLKEASFLYTEDDLRAFSKPKEIMAQLKTELGKGNFILRGQIDKPNNNEFILHIFDKNSVTHLDVETDSLFYQYGDTLIATISLHNDMRHFSIEHIEAILISPSGDEVPLNIMEKSSNQFEATGILTSDVSDNGENWYIKVAILSNKESGPILRDAQTAFSYSIPSATLLNIKKSTTQPLVFIATVDVATPSRYSLQGVLYQNKEGKLSALEAAQTSEWLESGLHYMKFTFDNTQQLSDDNLYLGTIRLLDFGQLKLVYQYPSPINLSSLLE